MVNVPKVLVVDDGERAVNYALSAELAELGFSSVTASLEAAEEVLALISTPSAILVQLPRRSEDAAYTRFLEEAIRLKTKGIASGIPVILVDPAAPSGGSSFSAMLQSQIGAGALAKPER